MNPIIEFYHRLRYIAANLFGPRFDELEWRYRHIYARRWAEGYIKSFSHPHRQLLVQKISANAPLTSVLEVGCATGPNLYLLARKFPDARIVGIDINPEAIRLGKLFFERQGIQNVSLLVGKADQLQRFPDKSFDVVFTDAVLLYVGPGKIKRVAAEFLRIARKAIVCLEHHSEQESGLGSYREKWWLRNYRKLFQLFSDRINMTKIPPEIWGGNWAKFGYIIEIKLP